MFADDIYHACLYYFAFRSGDVDYTTVCFSLEANSR